MVFNMWVGAGVAEGAETLLTDAQVIFIPSTLTPTVSVARTTILVQVAGSITTGSLATCDK